MTKPSVFLDTSFLISSQLEGHEFYDRTLAIRKLFLDQKYKLYTSWLVFDEFWYVLTGIWKASEQRTDRNQLHISLIQTTQAVLKFENLEVLETGLTNKELINTLEIMYQFKLRPRDALIIEIMKKARIRHIASFDKDFDGIRDIKRIC